MSSRALTWAHLHLPVPVHPDAAESAVRALAGLSGSPRVVLEALGRRGLVLWRLGAERDQLSRVVAALRPHLGGLRVERSSEGANVPEPTVATQLRVVGQRTALLDSTKIEPVSRGVLAALAAAQGDEVTRLQVVLGARYAPRRSAYSGFVWPVAPTPDATQRREETRRLAEPRFGCGIRLAATGTEIRSRSLIRGVLSALRGLEAPGARLALRRASRSAVMTAAVPFFWALELTVSEVTALLGWPVASRPDAALIGVPPQHPRLLPAAASVPRTGRILGHSTLAPERKVALRSSDSLRHLHLLGPNGVGKSTLMARLALADMAAGHGVVVIDPKGDLVADLLARIPESRLDDVVVLDPTDPGPVGIDCFHSSSAASQRGNPDLVADVLLGVFHSLYESAWGPRTSDILHACLLSLARRSERLGADAGVNLLMVPLLLTNPGFRRSVIGSVVKADPLGLGSFWATFEAWSDAERSQAIQPLMNKLRQLLLRPGLRGVFGQRQARLTLSDVFAKRRILLVNLSEGMLGPEAAQLLGSLVVGLLWQAALGRTQLPERLRTPVFVHVDEMQRYVRLGDVGDALARARGLGVGFTLAHQHLGQLSKSLRDAVMANARSKVAFQLPLADSTSYAALTAGLLAPQDFQALPAFHAYAQLLAGNQPSPWCSLVTEPLPFAVGSGHADRVRALSRTRYGRSLDEIERELARLATGAPDGRTTTNPASERLGRRRPHTPSGGAE